MTWISFLFYIFLIHSPLFFHYSPGKFCQTAGLTTPSGSCDAGSYCTLGASVQAPRDNITGNVCPPGAYCDAGTGVPKKCEPGHYSSTSGNKQLKDCLECQEGKYCTGWGLHYPSGNCSAGFYCPSGQNSSNPEEYRCTPGYYCPEGSKARVPCPAGLFQDEFYGKSCKVCPEGHYCNGLVLNDTHCEHGVQLPLKCPQGFFCGNASKTGKEKACPKGRSNSTPLSRQPSRIISLEIL